MDNWIERFRSAKHIDGNPVQIPGDQERNFRSERLVSGLPLIDPVVDSLKELGERFGVKF
jgi:LDH2 family malate/lactate/ureidoglycolate dehydrogenase